MSSLPISIEKLVQRLERLPGVGPKSAARLAYYFLRAPDNYVSEVSELLIQVKENITYCQNCFNLCENDTLCKVCKDTSRNLETLCVVEEFLDLHAFELTKVYNGMYFVLGGLISPLQGVGPEELRIQELLNKLSQQDSKVVELIIAFNPTMEGEATASYITDRLSKLDVDVKISRLARGLPTGADLKYADYSTLKRSLEGRISA